MRFDDSGKPMPVYVCKGNERPYPKSGKGKH